MSRISRLFELEGRMERMRELAVAQARCVEKLRQLPASPAILHTAERLLYNMAQSIRLAEDRRTALVDALDRFSGPTLLAWDAGLAATFLEVEQLPSLLAPPRTALAAGGLGRLIAAITAQIRSISAFGSSTTTGISRVVFA